MGGGGGGGNAVGFGRPKGGGETRGTFTAYSCTICRCRMPTTTPRQCEIDCHNVNNGVMSEFEYIEKYEKWIYDATCNQSGPIPPGHGK